METWRAASVPTLPGRGPEPHLANTATGQLARAADGQRASLYACGITPYDATHIGHAATYVAWDLLVRAWRDAGHEVTYVQNVTDVDDPLLERADRDGEDWRALADPKFGAVAHLSVPEMVALSAERGGDPGRPGKKDPLDCLVWLVARPGEPSWDSGFGPGRPGWHVECAAIATHYLGPVFAVQAGGSDLIFPHHECSASHARVAFADVTRESFARNYAHGGMVRQGGEKMSKSLGNLVFVSGLLRGGADPMAIRLAILAHHYRHDWDWTEEGLAEAQARLGRWRAAVAAAAAGPSTPGHSVPADPVPPADSVLAAVRARLADDLDAPGALAAVDGWADAVLAGSGPAAGPGPEAARLARDTVDALLGVAL